MYYTYILHSQKLSKYYVGYSDDVENRFKKHLTDHKGFTGKAKDWKMGLCTIKTTHLPF